MDSSLNPPSDLGSRVVMLVVDAQHHEQRIDNFLIRLLKGVPKNHIYRIIRKGEVRVNKSRINQTVKLNQGDLVRVPPVRLAEPKNQTLDSSRYQFLQNAVLFEDDTLLVINKPSGLAVHSGSGIQVGVIEALRTLRPDLAFLDLAHRLDRETSGVLVLAKKMSALRILGADFSSSSHNNKRLDKRYLALVKGCWRYGERYVTKPLNTESRRGRQRYVTVSSCGRYASSVMRPLQANKIASLIEVTLLTGRTHQARVHAQSENHPIAADATYGDADFNRLMKQQFGLKRLFLHARSLQFRHPQGGERMLITAPIPKDLNQVISKLGLQSV